MMLALTLLILLNASKAGAYVAADNVDAETKVLNDACHLASANVVLLLM